MTITIPISISTTGGLVSILRHLQVHKTKHYTPFWVTSFWERVAQSNLIALFLLNWHPTHTLIWGRLSAFWKMFALHRYGHAKSRRLMVCQWKRKMILTEGQTWRLLYYYKDIKQEIVHTLLLEECGVQMKWVIIMDKRQDSNTSLTQAYLKTSGPSAQNHYFARSLGEARRNGVETEKSRIKPSHCDLCYVCWCTLFLIKCVGIEYVLRFVSHRVWFDKEFLIWRFFYCCFV